MTTDEKIKQLFTVHVGNASSLAQNYSSTSLGQVFAAQFANFSSLADSLRQRNELQSALVRTSRLGIPISVCIEGLHSGAWGGTLFPAPPTLAASWNRSLWSDAFKTVALEARASGADTLLTPVVNMITDARFGRFSEGFSPDPTLTAHAGEAVVMALQGGPRQEDGPYSYLPDFNTSAVSLAKHFAGYGQPDGGINGGITSVSNRTVRKRRSRRSA